MTNQRKKTRGKTEKEIKSKRGHKYMVCGGCLQPEKMTFLSIILLLEDYAKMTNFYIFTQCYSQCLYQDNDLSLVNPVCKRETTLPEMQPLLPADNNGEETLNFFLDCTDLEWNAKLPVISLYFVE